MIILDKCYIEILEKIESIGKIEYDLLRSKYGFQEKDIRYLNQSGLIDSNNTLTDRYFWLSGEGKNFLATIRLNEKKEREEEKRWKVTKKQAKWGMIIAGAGIVASLVMSILALVLD